MVTAHEHCSVVLVCGDHQSSRYRIARCRTSRPFAVHALWSVEHFQVSGLAMRMPRPPGNSSCSHVYANDAYPASGVHVDCEVLYSLHSIFTLQHSHVQTRCGAALIALTCNCHEPPTSDVRQTELGRPNSDSLRCRDWAQSCHCCALSGWDALLARPLVCSSSCDSFTLNP
jgi:hypothetical protein